MTGSEHTRILAERYTRNAQAYLRHWAGALVGPGRALIDGLDLGDAERVLEVAAGTGRLLPHLAEAAPLAEVVAVDLSEGMIRLAPRQFGRVVADVTSLPFEGDIFDAALMAFALFHVLEPVPALAEIARVLKSKGALAVATWEVSDDSPAQQIFMGELDRLGVPELEPRASSGELMDSTAKLSRLLQRVGLTAMATDTREVVDQMDVEEFLQRATCLGLHGERYMMLPTEKRPAFLEHLDSLLREVEPDDLTERETAVLAWARKPG